MLNHAFEMILANRVELNIDARNVRSQRAIERLGAVRDGVLRCHTIHAGWFCSRHYELLLHDEGLASHKNLARKAPGRAYFGRVLKSASSNCDGHHK
jgi:hypothetical protein